MTDEEKERQEILGFLKRIEDIKAETGMELEFLTSFFQHYKPGVSISEAGYHAMCDWDL